MLKNKIRVRVAPSPTGDPHVGLAYITLFNYVFAAKHEGELVLRIEDTDRTRYKVSSETNIMKSLRWLGLKWQEGPDVGGKFGPYRQSERLSIYKKHVDQLIEKKSAYYCFCSSERLSEMREKQKKQGLRTKYDGLCRSLSNEYVNKKLKNNSPYVIRLKMPLSGKSSFTDLLRKKIEIDYEMLDDQVLMKSDGFPTYHLASVVDDHLMKISHVIRAEEWISSTPKHTALYDAFGWDKPTFVHLPLLRNNDRSKISKRKNPTSIEFYRQKGILPQSMVNFLALMGWSYDGNTEFFSLSQMIKKFDLEQIHLGGPIFDVKKLLWVNQHYMKKLSKDEFIDQIKSKLFSTKKLESIFPLAIDRLDSFDQFVDSFSFFFNSDIEYHGLPIIPKTKDKKEMKTMFKELLVILDDLYDWDEGHLQQVLSEFLKRLNWKPKEFYMPIRLVTTGRKDSPPLISTLAILGRETVRYRLQSILKSHFLT